MSFSNVTKNIYRSSSLIPWMKQGYLNSLEIVKAQGHFIYTEKKQITDFTCGMVVSLGHNNPHVQNSIMDHLKTGIAYVPSNFFHY